MSPNAYGPSWFATLDSEHRPPFIGVKTGDLVLVQSRLNPDPCDRNWWIGWIAENPDQSKEINGRRILKVIDTDRGEVRCVNAENATRLCLAGMERCNVIPLTGIG